MKKSKALLLLLIFLLSTGTGFACTLRMSIHEQGEAIEHHHEGEETTEHHHEHGQVSKPASHQSYLLNRTYVGNNDACCQGAVNQFNSLAKVTPQSSQITLLAPYTYVAAYYQFFLKPVSVCLLEQSGLIDGRRRPPTHPIRIALQSFQI